MVDNYEWFLSDGSILTGKEAEEYLSEKLKSYQKIIKQIETTMHSVLELNQLVVEEELPSTIIGTSENLGYIQTELELLLEDLSIALGQFR